MHIIVSRTLPNEIFQRNEQNFKKDGKLIKQLTFAISDLVMKDEGFFFKSMFGLKKLNHR